MSSYPTPSQIQSSSINKSLLALTSTSLIKIIAITINAPLHLLQARYQTMGQMKRNHLIEQNYKGYFDCFKRTVKQQGGYKALFKGNFAKIMVALSGNLFALTLGEYAKHQAMLRLKNQPTLDQQAMSNTVRNFVTYGTVIITYPLQYAYIRLVTDKQSIRRDGKKQFTGIRNVLSETLKSDGIRGIYRGILTSFAGTFMYRIAYFGLYDTWTKQAHLRDASLFAKFIVGYMVTVLAGLITYPFSTIKRRMMMRSLELQTYSWSGACFTQVVKNQGFTALFRGYPINLVSAVFGACLLMVYDTWKMV